jgi:peptidoglycan hydrolase-like protein with peptidoglycan-binding domain
MNKIISISAGLIMLTAVSGTPVLAETTSSTSTIQELTQSLQQQITNLKAQIEALNNQLVLLKQTKGEIKETLGLIRQLRAGMSGEDVSLLQQILATDSEIYPEGLITGYFGKLTEKAVRKFQKIANLEQIGSVGPKTLSRINELLTEGAGKSGKVPPGLLIAPGIRKKLGLQTATSTPDVIAPVISGLEATSTIVTSTKIIWVTNELANSKVWYGTTTPLVIATSTLTASSSDLVLNHNITISGLTASTTYYYLTASADAAGNTATSAEKSFFAPSQ